MRTCLILIALATSLLIACNKSSSAPTSSAAPSTAAPSTAAPSSPAPQTMPAPSSNSQSGDAISQKLLELAGARATDCGRVRTQAQDQTQKATDCAMQAAKDKHAFYVGYDMPGLSVGYAGNSQGKLFSVQAEDSGAKPEAKSAPCPGELRIANSGRVTCMPPGSMGAMGGANPHGGMPPATGQSPHGMISMPPLDATKPSHPPAGKTPPKK